MKFLRELFLLNYSVPALRSGDLEPGERVLARFHASLLGRYAITRDGVVFITDRRVLWLQSRYFFRGGRVDLRYSDVTKCWLVDAHSAWKPSWVGITVGRYRTYNLLAGTRGYTLLVGALYVFPGMHNLLRSGDRSRQCFDAIRSAILASAPASQVQFQVMS